MKKNFIFSTARLNQVQVSVYASTEELTDRCILGLHGFKGFKDWGFWPFIASYLADEGYTVVLINFSHNGIGHAEDVFTEPEKFQKNTFSLELEETKEILTAIQKGTLLQRSFSSVSILGHSRGGAIGLLASHHEAVCSLATLGAVATLDRFTQRQKAEWLEKGSIGVVNTRTNQTLPLGVELYHDLTENSEKTLNLQRAASSLSKPWLIVHGEIDVTVPVKEAMTLFSWSDKSKTELVEIPQSGHTFEATHPFSHPSRGLISVVEHILNFFDRVTL